ncbi:DUF928 domain-containing protein [Kamptonema formosum]|uniref:DUF928 domain-containing protein n=1 Tax=Kamptonema formosum TaxID=331992 RepID=UPI0003795980|nr:DUF928 domain-containing protein [Oscillatoria sp. PCC 10802]
MVKYRRSVSQTVFYLSLAGTLATGTGLWEPAQALQPVSGEKWPGGSLTSLQFKPPGDAAPGSTDGGGTRGDVKFQPPGDSTPASTNGGGTRGDVKFQPPGDSAPASTNGGGTRGDVKFQPPGDASPTNTTGGGTRGPEFEPPSDAAPVSTVGAGTRSEELSQLIPLIPENKIGRTVAARPTFFVYVPATSSKEVFFSLQDENRNVQYQTTLKMSGQGGIVRVTLPADAPELEIGKNYMWFFATINEGDILRPDSRGVSGWVKRVEAPTSSAQNSSLTPVALATLYAESGIWYDTVAVLGAAKQAQPGDATLAAEWKELLEQVGLKGIATQPLID